MKSPDSNPDEWTLSDNSPSASDWNMDSIINIYVSDATTVTAEDIVAVQNTFDIAGVEITASGSGSLDSPSPMSLRHGEITSTQIVLPQ